MVDERRSAKNFGRRVFQKHGIGLLQVWKVLSGLASGTHSAATVQVMSDSGVIDWDTKMLTVLSHYRCLYTIPSIQ